MFAGTSKCLHHVTAAMPRLYRADISSFQDLHSLRRFFNEGAWRRSMNLPMTTQEGVTNHYDVDVHHDFFNYTSGRWIYNESRQLSARRVEFSVPALKAVAAHSVGASECIRMVKLPEGLFNRAFLMSFDNGVEVVARIPTSLAGPAHWNTASEVATMKLMHALGIPIPKVLAWSSRANTEVGSEYIIMEKAQGVPLVNVWESIKSKRRGKVIAELVSIDEKMLNFEFCGYGSIFLEQDIEGVRSLPINSNPEFSDYRIGPSVMRNFWKDERLSMSIDRGPWSNLEDYLSAVAKREISWIKMYARPRSEDDLFRRSASQENPATHIELLERYLKLIPCLASIIDFKDPVILHMDLHLGNIFVESAEQPRITSIIDWQGVDIRPLCLAARFPRLVDYEIGENPITLEMPILPKDFDKLDEQQKRNAVENKDAVMLKKFWLAKTIQKNNRHADAVLASGRELLLSLWRESGRSWDGEIASFRHDLMEIVDQWQTLGCRGHCPIKFSSEEAQGHKEELKEYNDMVEMMEGITNTLGINAEGRVSHERYDAVKAANEDWRKSIAISLSNGDDDLREQWEKWWPFSDRA